MPDDLYERVWRLLPIPCVDLMVTTTDQQLLLVRRANEPGRGLWWFPGGRVHYGETRAIAAIRKLKEECGLIATEPAELGTYDVTLAMGSDSPPRHCITTLYQIRLGEVVPTVVDGQSMTAMWRPAAQWAGEDLHPFVASRIHDYIACAGRVGRM